MPKHAAHEPEHIHHTAKQAEHHLHHAEKHLHQARRLNVLSFIMLAVGVVMIGLGVYLIQHSNDIVPVKTAISAPQVTKLGQTLTTPAYQMQLSDLKRDSLGDDNFKPSAGHEFLVMTMTVKNSTTTKLQFLPVLQTYLKDSLGNTYSLTPAPLVSPIQSGSFLPGDTLTGQVSYEIPKGKTDLSLYFDPGWPGSGGARVIKLSN